ncbi:kinase-like protein [Hypoxylon sp. FL1284]|nr:kinase-like protein [Hypoxylon sp. FL1284]
MPRIPKSTRAQNDANSLREFFTNEPRFQFRGLVSNGSYGSAIRVGYRDPQLTDFLIKMAFDDEDAIRSLQTEKGWLRKLAYNPHVVQLINIASNPLQDPRRQGRPDADRWIIIEWLRCGTLRDFVAKAKTMSMARLPNRLLWRYFLCLVRACIAMAWPDNRERINNAVESSGLMHNDMHLANVLLDNPPTDEEHTITPILKLIDFGIAGAWEASTIGASSEQSNLRDIGKVMASVIKLDPLLPSMFNAARAQFQWSGNTVLTDGGGLVPRPAGVDRDLVDVVCACMATDFRIRPSLPELLDITLTAVRQRGPDFYGGEQMETDAEISRIWQEIIHNAPTQTQDVIEISS